MVESGVAAPVESVCGPIFEWSIQRIRSVRTPGRIKRLARWIKEQQFDVAHAWDMDEILFGTMAARMAGVPTITSRRDLGTMYPAWKRRIRRHGRDELLRPDGRGRNEDGDRRQKLMKLHVYDSSLGATSRARAAANPRRRGTARTN